MPIRLAIASTDLSKAGELLNVCSHSTELEVVAVVTTGMEALAVIDGVQPDVLFLDINISAPGALDVLATMKSAESTIPVVMLIEDEDDDGLDALRFGARGVIHHATMTQERVVECAREVYAGKSHLEHKHLMRVLDVLIQRETGMNQLSAVLSRRQIEIAMKVVTGMPNSDLAQELGITPGSLKGHLHNLYTKLNVSGRSQLVQLLNSKLS